MRDQSACIRFHVISTRPVRFPSSPSIVREPRAPLPRRHSECAAADVSRLKLLSRRNNERTDVRCYDGKGERVRPWWCSSHREVLADGYHCPQRAKLHPDAAPQCPHLFRSIARPKTNSHNFSNQRGAFVSKRAKSLLEWPKSSFDRLRSVIFQPRSETFQRRSDFDWPRSEVFQRRLGFDRPRSDIFQRRSNDFQRRSLFD